MARSLALFALAAPLLAALLLVPTANAAALAQPVPAGDTAAGQGLTPRRAVVAFLDLDFDQQADAAGPAEPLYLDADASGTVNFGDLRLTPFGAYGAGSDVQAADTDNDRTLTAAGGWFAAADGAWYGDVDGSSTVSAGDLRLATGDRVGSTDSMLGTALARSSLVPMNMVDIRDTDGDGRRDAGESLYLDLDRNQAVSPGDLRFLVVAAATGTSGASATGSGHDGEGSSSGTSAEDERGVRGLDVVLIALVVLNLAGLAYAIREARSGRPPRNPFK